jgi:HprK-related kinase B
MTLSMTMNDIVGENLKAQPANHRVKLQFGDVSVDVLTNSAELRDKLLFYYQDFMGHGHRPVIEITAVETLPLDLDVPLTVKKPDPGKTKIKEEYADLVDGRIVRKRLTGMVFVFGGDRHVALGPCVSNDNQVINFINNRFIEHLIKDGCLLFHAAGIAWKGRGLVISGFSGTGKSTLALHIMRSGTDFVSNDRVMVKRSPQQRTMYGVAKMPRVNPGTVLNNDLLRSVIPEHERLRFEALPPDELWDLEHKYDAFIDQCFGRGKFKVSCPMAGLVVLNWERTDAPCEVRTVDLGQRKDLLPAFMKSVGLFFELDDATLRLDFSETAYLDLLKGCPVLEITGGVDFDAASRGCLDFLHGLENSE